MTPVESVVPSWPQVGSTDIFVTYRCGLRCTHCFVGDLLSSSRDMPKTDLMDILDTCKTWGSTEVTFLGGEPTLYPHLVEAILRAKELGLDTRIVTNGQGAFRKLLSTTRGY